ncbi:hypothetical protein RYX45_24710, partial [Alkalihalophilus pseudofirmus]
IQTERVEDLIEEAESKVSAYERSLQERGFDKGSDINHVKDPLEAREIEINLKFIERNETRLQGYENHDWKKVVGEEIKIL